MREQLDLEPGEKVVFRFDDEDGVRLVNVPADPMDRPNAAQQRAASLELDAAELIERERDQWNRVQ